MSNFLTRQEEGLLCQVQISLQLFVSKFQVCSAFDGAAGESHWGPWSAKTGFRVAAEVASLFAEIGGFFRLRYFFCSQVATAVLTTSFASSVETAGPLIDTCSNEHVDL